jgi:hypothetical protein
MYDSEFPIDTSGLGHNGVGFVVVAQVVPTTTTYTR